MYEVLEAEVIAGAVLLISFGVLFSFFVFWDLQFGMKDRWLLLPILLLLLCGVMIASGIVMLENQSRDKGNAITELSDLVGGGGHDLLPVSPKPSLILQLILGILGIACGVMCLCFWFLFQMNGKILPIVGVIVLGASSYLVHKVIGELLAVAS